MSILLLATACTATAVSAIVVYRLVTRRGPYLLHRRRLRPVTVSDTQWKQVCEHTDFTDYRPDEFEDLLEVLQAAQSALGYRVNGVPPALPQLADIGLWDTSDDNGWDFVMTVDVNPLVRVASTTIQIRTFTELRHGPDGARAVLGELLTERDLPISLLAKAIPA